MELARRRDLNDIDLRRFPGEDAIYGFCDGAQKVPVTAAICGDAEAAAKLIESSPNPISAQTLFLRGLNFTRSGKAIEAMAEFQKLLDHKGVNWGPFYAPAYVGLARAAAKAGDKARARKAYQDFLALWKDADADLPLLIAARNEAAAIR
jgi:tetratricopeptide (TPR) repeat protein